jgi:hypothetical protein
MDHVLAKGVLALGLLAASLPASAQNRETRPLAGFDAIAVGGGIDLFVRLGEEFRVEVETDGDLAEIVTEVRDGTLEIHRPRSVSRIFDWGDDGAVHVTLPKLTALRASGGSDVRGEGTFSGDRLELVASGGSDLAIDVAVDTLHATVSGGSDARLAGSARSARLHTSGGSDLDASGLSVVEAEIRGSGGSDVEVSVSYKLVARASGGSDIIYRGNPMTVSIDASGGSDVRRR